MPIKPNYVICKAKLSRFEWHLKVANTFQAFFWLLPDISMSHGSLSSLHLTISSCVSVRTRCREDMNFMFEWQEQYLTSERSERVRYCSCHENIKFISSSQRVMFFLLYGETNSTKAKGGNRDVIERYDTHKGDIRKIRHSGPGWSGVWNLRVV